MLADGLTKLAPAGVIGLLHAAMHGEHFPTHPKVATARAEPDVTVCPSSNKDDFIAWTAKKDGAIFSAPPTPVDEKDPVFEQDPWRQKDSRPAHTRVVRRFKLSQLWGMITCLILRTFVLPSMPSITESTAVPTYLVGAMQPQPAHMLPVVDLRRRQQFSDLRDSLMPH